MKIIKMFQRKWRQQKIFMLKELLEIFHNIESIKNKVLKADSNLEKSMTIYQGRGKMLTP